MNAFEKNLLNYSYNIDRLLDASCGHHIPQDDDLSECDYFENEEQELKAKNARHLRNLLSQLYLDEDFDYSKLKDALTGLCDYFDQDLPVCPMKRKVS